MNKELFKQLFKHAPERYPSNLENRYARIFNKIIELWDTPELMRKHLKDLVVDTRGDRAGFPQEVLEELLFVSHVYELAQKSKRKLAAKEILEGLGKDKVADLLGTLQKMSVEKIKEFTHFKSQLFADDPLILESFKKQFDINQRDQDGQTFLMNACMMGAEKVAIALCNQGANPHIQDAYGNTALHYAVLKNQLRIINVLLFFGADVDTENDQGSTPYLLSASKPNIDIMKKLLDYGPNVLITDKQNNNALHKAVLANNVAAIELLINLGVPAVQMNREGLTASAMAAKNPILKKIIDDGIAKLSEAAFGGDKKR